MRLQSTLFAAALVSLTGAFAHAGTPPAPASTSYSMSPPMPPATPQGTNTQGSYGSAPALPLPTEPQGNDASYSPDVPSMPQSSEVNAPMNPPQMPTMPAAPFTESYQMATPSGDENPSAPVMPQVEPTIPQGGMEMPGKMPCSSSGPMPSKVEDQDLDDGYDMAPMAGSPMPPPGSYAAFQPQGVLMPRRPVMMRPRKFHSMMPRSTPDDMETNKHQMEARDTDDSRRGRGGRRGHGGRRHWGRRGRGRYGWGGYYGPDFYPYFYNDFYYVPYGGFW